MRGPLLFAGAACGMAFSTHYYTIFLTLPLVLAIYFRARQRGEGWGGDRDAAVHDGRASPRRSCSSRCRRSCSSSRHGLAGHRGQPSDRRRPRRRRRSAGAFASAPAYARMLWTEGLRRADPPGRRSRGVVLAARSTGDRWRAALVLIAFPVAFLLSSATRCAAEPVSQSGAAGRRPPSRGCALSRLPLRPVLIAMIAAGISVAPLLPQPADRACSSSRPTRGRSRSEVIERTVPARRDRPGPALLRRRSTQSRESLVEALQAHLGDPRQGLDQVRAPAGAAIPTPPRPTGPSIWATAGSMSTRSIVGYRRSPAGSGASGPALAAAPARRAVCGVETLQCRRPCRRAAPRRS